MIASGSAVLVLNDTVYGSLSTVLATERSVIGRQVDGLLLDDAESDTSVVRGAELGHLHRSVTAILNRFLVQSSEITRIRAYNSALGV